MVNAYLSQLYSAIVPSLALSSEGLNVTVLWAGAPGNPQPEPEAEKKVQNNDHDDQLYKMFIGPAIKIDLQWSMVV